MEKELTLFEGSFESTPVTMSSREIASLTGKRHGHVLRDCDKLNESYESLGLLKIEESTYEAENGHTYREYRLTRMQYFDLMAGYSRELRIKVNRHWEELEKKERTQLPTSFADAQQLAADQQKKIEQQQKRLDEAVRRHIIIRRWAEEHGTNRRVYHRDILKSLSYQHGYKADKTFDSNYGEASPYHRRCLKCMKRQEMETVTLNGITYEVCDTPPKGFTPRYTTASPSGRHTLWSNGVPRYLFDGENRKGRINPAHRWALVKKR